MNISNVTPARAAIQAEKRLQEPESVSTTVIQNAVLLDSSLSPGARLVYMRFQGYAQGYGSCPRNQEEMARELGVGTRTLRKYLCELLKAGLITSERRGHYELHLAAGR